MPEAVVVGPRTRTAVGASRRNNKLSHKAASVLPDLVYQVAQAIAAGRAPAFVAPYFAGGRLLGREGPRFDPEGQVPSDFSKGHCGRAGPGFASHHLSQVGSGRVSAPSGAGSSSGLTRTLGA